MSVRKRLGQRIAAVLAAAAVLVGVNVILSETQAPAQAATYCRTVYLNHPYFYSAIRPKMTVPVCYNGSNIWVNGNTTAGVDTTGYSLNGISWQGVYNNGGSWLGAGLNYSVTIYGGWASFSCATRWHLNAWGNVTYYSRGC